MSHHNSSVQRLQRLMARLSDNLDAIFITAVSAFISIRTISEPSLWLDEGVSWQQSRGGFIETLVLTAQDNYPPLHNLILNLMINVFGDSELSLRLPSALLMSLSVLLVFLIGARFFDRRVGLAAATLTALSQFNLYFAQEARNYALFAFTSLFYTWSVYRWLELRTLRTLLLVSLAAVLLLYSHVYGVFHFASVFCGVIVFALITRQLPLIDLKRWMLGHVLAFLLFLPWLVILTARVQAVYDDFWIPYPSPALLAFFLVRLFNNYYELAAISVGAVIATAIFLYLFVKSLRRNVPTSIGLDTSALKLFILIAAIIGPFLAGYLASIALRPILIHRYLIGALPLAYIFAMYGYSRIIKSHTFNFVVLSLAAINFYYLSPTMDRIDVRSAVETYRRVAQADDCVFFYPGSAAVFEYYLRQLPACHVTAAKVTDVDPAKLGRSYAWLLLSNNFDDNAVIAQELFWKGWQVQQANDWNGPIFLIRRR